MLDIRIPIGLMFTIFGAILLIFGLVYGPEVYKIHSGDININLVWGIVMLVFGGIFLFFSRWKNQN